MKPQTTVFCAVYSQDPDRHALLAAHAQNLARQTVPVETVYVFENADPPPAGFAAPSVMTSGPLTIYEAWNVALSLCRTPFVMNLNLDDRLHADAVERLEQELHRQDAALVGGDWNICYSQEETDRVGTCHPAADLPFVTTWPPTTGTRTRLGSGTGQRGTFGPAVMWRLSAHVGFPRYPYRTNDDYRIRSVADAVWWSILRNHLKKKVARLPLVVGNYHSHPTSQAEFRVAGEWKRLNGAGISPV